MYICSRRQAMHQARSAITTYRKFDGNVEFTLLGHVSIHRPSISLSSEYAASSQQLSLQDVGQAVRLHGWFYTARFQISLVF